MHQKQPPAKVARPTGVVACESSAPGTSGASGGVSVRFRRAPEPADWSLELQAARQPASSRARVGRFIMISMGRTRSQCYTGRRQL